MAVIRGNSGIPLITVDSFTDLPAPASVPMHTLRYVLTESGSYFLFNKKLRGIYQNDGAAWVYAGDLESQASSVVVDDSGIGSGSSVLQTVLEYLGTAKQNALVSGTNIKTINGASVLGSGNLAVSGSIGSINDASDVDTVSSAPSVGDVLRWNGTNWVPGLGFHFVNVLTNAFSSTSITRAAVTGWSFSVDAGKSYRITILASFQSAATTTGGSMGFVLTSGTGTIHGNMQADIAQTTVATGLKTSIRAINSSNTTAGSFMTSSGVGVINSPHNWAASAVFNCTTGGTFVVQWATEVAASASQLNIGSALIVERLT